MIIVIAEIDGYEVRLALDTGASNTVIDLTALMIAGYHPSQASEEVEIETGKGNILANAFKVESLSALGMNHSKFTVFAYDFLANQILTEVDGVLGFDFFIGKKLCIDFRNFVITVQ